MQSTPFFSEAMKGAATCHTMTTTTLDAPRYSLKAGWICLVICVLAIGIAGPLGMIVGGPLFLVCVILAIIGMAKNRTGGGVALLLCSLVLPSVAFLVWMFAMLMLKAPTVETGTSGQPAPIETYIEVESSAGDEVPVELPEASGEVAEEVPPGDPE